MASFLGEIRRRKVFQVAAVYAVVAWLVIQIIDVVGEPLNLPEWFDTVVIVLFAVGFPIAVILAWAFDVTPQGIRATSDAETGDVPTQPTGQRLNYVTHGLVLLAVGFLVVDQYFLEQRTNVVTVDASSAFVSPTSTPTRRLAVVLGPTERVGSTGLDAHVAVSPDGRFIVYAAKLDGVDRLFLRPLDQLSATPMAGTEGAHHPFFSPDSEWVAFYSDSTDHKLKRVRVLGGVAQTLADSAYAPGGGWD